MVWIQEEATGGRSNLNNIKKWSLFLQQIQEWEKELVLFQTRGPWISICNNSTKEGSKLRSSINQQAVIVFPLIYQSQIIMRVVDFQGRKCYQHLLSRCLYQEVLQDQVLIKINSNDWLMKQGIQKLLRSFLSEKVFWKNG